ncbi:GTP pyrophosphokinase YwaC [Clostridium magnum DSM 2767]|uniref:GTP pyrophosphokinase YwaC n=2 Tax=Clostridium magnum TaxID=33954 RepID=A0A161WHX5_9CLOT|nr:hypothetical protein [Clostridium magnum]KZL91315.1 GTP pyrophosphokinase YwaC [Clostridium magnum DSM 2767]SHH87139.1 ppGpp synthetase catalytic domain-containing protein (RelA/SpoT-type nucleotidyltranferase) [Clostridium magnum DSM 2767]
MYMQHGRMDIWDLDIDSYDDVFLTDLYDDTIIDFVGMYLEEPFEIYSCLKRYNENEWTVNVLFKDFIKADAIKYVYEDRVLHFADVLDFGLAKYEYDSHRITFLIKDNMSLKGAYEHISLFHKEIIEDCNCFEAKKLNQKVKGDITTQLPIYYRAMTKIKMEIENFKMESKDNGYKVIDVSGRVKDINSIEEKVYRKQVSQYSICNTFDDIAGVRCTCEFLDNVYEVMEYLQTHPLMKIIQSEDKIQSPSIEGYRGIHIIAVTDIYYRNTLYKDIKVEIQIRTSFQNTWSMKTHQLTYKRNKDLQPEIIEIMCELSNTLNNADIISQEMKNKIRCL